MKQIPLYCFLRPDGGQTVSTSKPDAEYTELVRLVADEGMILTDGTHRLFCVDTESPALWAERKDDGFME